MDKVENLIFVISGHFFVFTLQGNLQIFRFLLYAGQSMTFRVIISLYKIISEWFLPPFNTPSQLLARFRFLNLYRAHPAVKN